MLQPLVLPLNYMDDIYSGATEILFADRISTPLKEPDLFQPYDNGLNPNRTSRIHDLLSRGVEIKDA